MPDNKIQIMAIRFTEKQARTLMSNRRTARCESAQKTPKKKKELASEIVLLTKEGSVYKGEHITFQEFKKRNDNFT